MTSTPSTARRTSSGSRKSPSTSSAPSPRSFSGLASHRHTRPRTSCPAFSSASARLAPILPEIPVTSTFIALHSQPRNRPPGDYTYVPPYLSFSRPWSLLISSDRLLGQTGKSVKPRLLITIGTSGALQYTTGIQGSETIIAINRDAQAPIFDIADLGLVGDAHSILTLLVEKLRKRL